LGFIPVCYRLLKFFELADVCNLQLPVLNALTLLGGDRKDVQSVKKKQVGHVVQKGSSLDSRPVSEKIRPVNQTLERLHRDRQN